jgi:hypothetical protein
MTLMSTFDTLHEPFTLTDEQIRRFREDGFIKLKDVLAAEVIEHYGPAVTRFTLDHNPLKDKPLDQRDTYGKAFIQVSNIWTQDPIVKEFSFSRRLARLAAELMGVGSVRMWHDQALYKEPGGGFTPWHADQYYWPFSSSLCCTAWIPLQKTPIEMGPLCFAKGTHLKNMGRELVISDDSEQRIRDMIRQHGAVEVFEPYDLGEVSFHYGWTLHRAGPNITVQPRQVHTVIYMDHEMRLAQPRHADQQKDWEKWTPTSRVGEVMNDALNPVIWSGQDS